MRSLVLMQRSHTSRSQASCAAASSSRSPIQRTLKFHSRTPSLRRPISTSRSARSRPGWRRTASRSLGRGRRRRCGQGGVQPQVFGGQLGVEVQRPGQALQQGPCLLALGLAGFTRRCQGLQRAGFPVQPGGVGGLVGLVGGFAALLHLQGLHAAQQRGPAVMGLRRAQRGAGGPGQGFVAPARRGAARLQRPGALEQRMRVGLQLVGRLARDEGPGMGGAVATDLVGPAFVQQRGHGVGVVGHQPQHGQQGQFGMRGGGLPDAAAKADRIFALETKIAKAHATRAESEDFSKSAEEWSRSEFATRAPGIDWNAFFAAAQLGNQGKFAAYHAKAITRLSALVATEPLDSWKDWLAFHQLSSNADVLPVKFDDARFAFYGTALSGTKAIRPRDKRALAALSDAMGDAVGKLYTEKYFPASAKAEVQTMVGAIKAAFAQRVSAIDWMASATKQEALAKVQNIVVGVGYPDQWASYDTLSVSPNNAYANKQAAQKLRYARQLAKIGKPMDRGEWWMNAQLVNAVNLPVQNGLNFPAAILQKPFFDPRADPAFNYGAIGAVIGHEISHSFDNNGAEFDASGKMRNWWTAQDRSKFEAAGKALADQYDAYEALPGLHVNGKLTLGENIADVAGLAAAFDAYHASLKGKAAPVIDGFTGDQRFFIAFAQGWASKMRDEALRGRIGSPMATRRACSVR